MRRIFLFLLGLCLIPFQAQGDSNTLSLKQALETARSLSPDVVLSKYDTSISQAERLKANRYPNPDVEFRIGPNFEDLDSGGTQTGLFVGGSVNQEVELWGRRNLRKKIADDQITLSKIQELITTHHIEEKIKILYASIQRGEERVVLIRENIKIAERFVGSAQMKFQQNQAPYADVIRAKMELARQHKNLVQEQGELKILKQQMNLVLARDLNTSFRAGDPFRVTVKIPSLESLLTMAGGRPEFQSAEVQTKQNEKEIRLAQQEWKPNLKVGLWAEKDAPDTHFGPSVGMEIPLWNRNKGEIAAAKAKKLKTEYQKTYLAKQVELDIGNKLLEIQETSRALSLQKEAIQDTGELFRTTFQSYLEGKADFLRFLETLQAVNQFKSEYYDLLFNYFVKKAELERAVGCTL
ncbi:MAG: TolC family protein [bacterium]